MEDKGDFEQYLIGCGLSVVTPSGKPSTVYDYLKRIDRVCDREGISWQTLRENIGAINAKYAIGGIEEDYGSRSHNAVRAALQKYLEFCLQD